MHPADRYAALVQDPAAFRATCDRPLPTVVRVNTLLATPAAARDAFAEAGIETTPRLWSENVLELATDRPGVTWPYVLGWVHGQEEISQLPARVLVPEAGDRLFDVAAAPGGKATQLAALQGGSGPLVANDVNLGRLTALRSNADRLGITNMAVTNQDARVFSTDPFGFETFDRVLVDAPCSGEGTIRKNPDVVDEWSEDALDGLADQQTGLLRRAIDLTRPGGVVVYATCTFAPEENERVLSRVLATEPCSIEPYAVDLEHCSGVRDWRGETFADAVVDAKRFFPHQNDTGGFFCAKLRVHAS